MNKYLNKWFWIKKRDGILDEVARGQWFIRGWEVLQCIEEKKDSVILCYRNNSMILQVLKSALEERPAPAFLPNDNVRIVKKTSMRLFGNIFGIIKNIIIIIRSLTRTAKC